MHQLIMTEAQNRALKFAYFVMGIALPIAGYLVWSKTDGFRYMSKKSRVDQAHDITVEDSFPASDPPSAW
jgi:hypothetical protein